jgi:hypothetical protein
LAGQAGDLDDEAGDRDYAAADLDRCQVTQQTRACLNLIRDIILSHKNLYAPECHVFLFCHREFLPHSEKF